LGGLGERSWGNARERRGNQKEGRGGIWARATHARAELPILSIGPGSVYRERVERKGGVD
jgi:hypothetical protein